MATLVHAGEMTRAQAMRSAETRVKLKSSQASICIDVYRHFRSAAPNRRCQWSRIHCVISLMKFSPAVRKNFQPALRSMRAQIAYRTNREGRPPPVMIRLLREDELKTALDGAHAIAGVAADANFRVAVAASLSGSRRARKARGLRQE